MTVPRENRIVRFYIQLEGELREKVMQHPSGSPTAMVGIAESLMKPYRLTYNRCDWWSIYSVRLHVYSQELHADNGIIDRSRPCEAIQTTCAVSSMPL
jgi:phenol 2-monooxygenase